jgi:uncharacterized protein with FMN-binding domain
MRRAIIATVGTVAALVAVLDYKSHGAVTAVQVAVPSTSSASPSSPTAAPATDPSTSSGSSSASTVPATTAPTATSSGGTYTGMEVQYQYGEIEISITIKDGKIAGLTLPVNTAEDPQSASINSQAVPILTKEALAAQGIHFDSVSGATYTSNAFAQAFQSALDKAGK